MRHRHPEPIKALREEALLDVLRDGRYDDEDRDLELRYKSAEILSARKYPRLVSPVLELLNSVIDSDSDFDFETEQNLKGFVIFSHTYTRRKLMKGSQNSSIAY